KQEDYPQVAVSVGMLDTGFDCREVLHIVMCRRIGSPILYQQIRGRGTRTAPHIGKQKFVIYDFFRNHERWNDSETEIFTSAGGAHALAVQPPPTMKCAHSRAKYHVVRFGFREPLRSLSLLISLLLTLPPFVGLGELLFVELLPIEAEGSHMRPKPLGDVAFRIGDLAILAG